MITTSDLIKEYVLLLYQKRDLKLEKSSLPKGSLQIKHINGCDYTYWQYYEAGHTKSFYIESNQVEALASRLLRYKAIGVELKEIEASRKALERALGKKLVQECVLDFLKNEVLTVAKNYPIKRISLFGSRATNQFKFNSDVDLLIEFSSKVGVLALSGLRIKLEEAIGMDVDIVSYPLASDSPLEIGKVVEIYAA